MKKIITLIISSCAMFLVASVPLATQVAAATTPQEQICSGSGGTWDASKKACINAAATNDVAGFMKSIINLLLYIIGAIAVLMVVIGGIRYVVSGGDQKAVTDAKNTILYAVIGLVVAMMAYAIVNFVVLNVK